MAKLTLNLNKNDMSVDPLRALWYCGIHPANNTFWAQILVTLALLISSLFVILAIQGVIVFYSSDIFFMAECLQTGILCTHTIAKILVLKNNKLNLLCLLKEKAIFWKLDEFEARSFEKFSKMEETMKQIFRLYFYLQIPLLICFDFQPFVTGNLPTALYCPPRWFYFLTLVSWYLSLFIVLCLSGNDTFFCSVSASVFMQFKLLQHKIQNKLFETENSTLEENLKHFIDYHDFLLRYCKLLNKTFRSIFLIQFFSSIMAGAVSVFIFTQPGPWFNRVKFVLYLVSSTIESAFYCVPLEYVSHAARELSTSIFASNWYKVKDNSLKKYLVIILARSQKTIIFNAYGLVVLNLQTFVIICKTMFSFYTYLTKLR